VLDIHRDAITDSDGNQYKLVSREDPNAAQCCLVMGVAYDTWADNLTLAVAVQETLMAQSPTLMRPMTVRGYNYNQQLSSGYMLVEVGAAGNSLDEAILGARLFAKGFAETII
jgi:stage II sporulation protein P